MLRGFRERMRGDQPRAERSQSEIPASRGCGSSQRCPWDGHRHGYTQHSGETQSVPGGGYASDGCPLHGRVPYVGGARVSDIGGHGNSRDWSGFARRAVRPGRGCGAPRRRCEGQGAGVHRQLLVCLAQRRDCDIRQSLEVSPLREVFRGRFMSDGCDAVRRDRYGSVCVVWNLRELMRRRGVLRIDGFR